MDIEFMWKDDQSNVGNCPAVYRAEGGYVVQGKIIDSTRRRQITGLGTDRDAVYVPANVIDRMPDREAVAASLHDAIGGYIVEGQAVDAETRGHLVDLDVDEDAVYVSVNVISNQIQDREAVAVLWKRPLTRTCSGRTTC